MPAAVDGFAATPGSVLLAARLCNVPAQHSEYAGLAAGLQGHGMDRGQGARAQWKRGSQGKGAGQVGAGGADGSNACCLRPACPSCCCCCLLSLLPSPQAATALHVGMAALPAPLQAAAAAGPGCGAGAGAAAEEVHQARWAGRQAGRQAGRRGELLLVSPAATWSLSAGLRSATLLESRHPVLPIPICPVPYRPCCPACGGVA